MQSHYRHAMGALKLSPEAREKIEGRLRRPRRTVPRPAAILAALALAIVLGATASAEGVYRIVHAVSPAIAQSLTPIQRSDTDQGITLTVQSVSMEEDTLTAYLTLEDQTGTRLEQGADLYDSYQVNTPFRAGLVLSGCASLGYDGESGACGYLVTIRPRDSGGEPVSFDGRRFTFTLNRLLLGQSRSECALSPDWSTLPTVPDTAVRYINGGSGDGFTDYGGWLSCGEAAVLQPGIWEMPVTEGVSLSAAGFLGGQLHLQLRYDGGPDSHGQLRLLDPEGEEIPACLALGFRDEDGTSYDEIVYDIGPSDLTGCTLEGRFVTGGCLLDGSWRVTFALDR